MRSSKVDQLGNGEAGWQASPSTFIGTWHSALRLSATLWRPVARQFRGTEGPAWLAQLPVSLTQPHVVSMVTACRLKLSLARFQSIFAVPFAVLSPDIRAATAYGTEQGHTLTHGSASKTEVRVLSALAGVKSGACLQLRRQCVHLLSASARVLQESFKPC